MRRFTEFVGSNMKKTILHLLIIICGNTVFAQGPLTETEKIATTAKVWGFLKYYHPGVGSGKYNWDEELFKVLPKIKNCKNTEQLSQVYFDWIKSLGDVKESKRIDPINDVKYFERNFDLNWIDNVAIFTTEVSKKLRHIETNRHQGKKHYVSSSKKVGNIEMRNEIDYKGFDWKDENLRLLSLFRYWNLIEYFFPYKYQTDTDWDEVLNTMIPKFLYPETETNFHLAMLELVVSINDSHAYFTSDKTEAFFGIYWIPAIFKLIDNKAVITSFHDDSLARVDDLRVGDVITKVNGKDVGEMFKEREKYITGSNNTQKKYMAFNRLFNGESSAVNIEYVRDGQTFSKSVSRYLYKDLNYKSDKLESFKILNGNIGYVNMGIIKSNDIPKSMASLQNTRAIIFDLRIYPKEDVHSVINYIASEGHNFYKKIYPDLDYPGKFIWQDGDHHFRKNEHLKYEGKVILLVNERTQSYAEFVAMRLQTGDHVTTIGSQTSGANGRMSELEMVGGFKTRITGTGIFYPDGTETQRKGVKIDIEVKPTIQGIIEGRDEVLDRAMEFVSE